MRWLGFTALLFFLALGLSVVGTILWHGFQGIDLAYLSSEPLRMGRLGGIGPMILATLWVNGLAVGTVLVVGVPLSLDYWLGSRTTPRTGASAPRSLTLSLMAGTPSIIFGLLGHSLFCQALGLGYSAIAGALTLACMLLPGFVAILSTALAEMPKDMFHAASALGISKTRQIQNLVLPSMAPALITALMASWTRAMGETAALMMTSGYSMRWPETPWDSMRTLPVHIYELSMNVAGGDAMAFRAAAVLLILTSLMGWFLPVLVRLLLQLFSHIRRRNEMIAHEPYNLGIEPSAG